MSGETLERLLWRHEYGRLSASRIELELNDELRRLSDARFSVEAHSASIALWNPELPAERDRALRDARQAMLAHRYREVIVEIRKCQSAMSAIHELLRAVHETERAEAISVELSERAQTPFLKSLPSVLSPIQVVETANGWLAEGRYRAAADLAAICARSSEPLMQKRRPTTEEQNELHTRTSALERLCSDTSWFAPSDEFDPAVDGSTNVLKALFDAHSVALALRLLMESEIRLAGRMRFLLHYRQKETAGAVQAHQREALRALVQERSWYGAVDSEWQEAVAAHASSLQRDMSRITSVAANLESALAE